MHVGNGMSGQLEVEANILGGVGVGDIVFMLHIPEVQGSASLSSVLLATPWLSTGEDVEDRASCAAEVLGDFDGGARMEDGDFFGHGAVVR